MLDDVLLIDLFHVENGLGGLLLPDTEIDIIPMMSGLPKLPVGYHVGVETRDECNVS
jgi:hypothetical protein